MFGLFVHRQSGVTAVQGQYATKQEAFAARTEYIRAARAAGFAARRRVVATFLRKGDVKLEVWVGRMES